MEQRRRINPLTWILIAGAIILLLVFLLPRGSSAREVEISQVLQLAETGQIATIEVTGDELDITTVSGESLRSRKESSVSLLEVFNERGIATGPEGVEVKVNDEGTNFLAIILTFLPFLLIGALIIFMMRRARGGINQAMDIGRSRARRVAEDRPAITFSDVAGADEAKQDLVEVVEFLRSPAKFTSLGAKIPRGVLLVGPPGTGKTLISKAVAGEAGVPFFSTSGSEFVEMFVGVGASRVRDLFTKAKANAPAVIFIDEIDAVGRHRGAGLGGGHDEREQTLNQILVEMDGFDTSTNIIVIAATNRPDILDPALVRPGRFDRRVIMDPPDVRGREAILKVHLKGKPLASDVNVQTIARETHGFSGADLANLVNEGAILTAREGKNQIGMSEFEEAIDRVIAGPARKSRKISEREKKIVAYHEAGHALVAAKMPNADPVHKVTIVARGASGGHTRLLPDEDRSLWSKAQFEAALAVMMGGHAAEQVIFGEVTTGASNDLVNATSVARKMVTEYGMSEELGPRTYETSQGQVFLGKELSQGHNYSDAIAQKIDAEMGALLRKARNTACAIIEKNVSILHRLADKLAIEETLTGAALKDILNGGSPGMVAAPA